MQRFSLLDTPHKGLRVALAELSQLAGSLNFLDQAEISLLQQKTEQVFTFLEEHAEVEEKYILPALEKLVPGSTVQDHEDHVHLHELQHLIQEKISNLPNQLLNNPASIMQDGKEIYQSLTRLQAAHLEHMLEEETGTQELMWEKFTDEEMMKIYRDVVAGFSLPSLLNSLRFILPAQNHQQRCMMVGGIKANAPAEVFEKILDLAREVLTENAFEKMTQEIAVPA